MTLTLMLPALLSLQPIVAEPLPSATPADTPVITDLAQLPLTEAAAPRCGIVFALIEAAQQAGDSEAKQWPDLANANGREFFVRAMAKLMEDRGLDQLAVRALAEREAVRLSNEDNRQAHALMEPCLLMKQTAGL